MSAPGIKITRTPYEEPYHLCLRLAASNGRLSADLEYYCNATDLGSLGKQLADFVGLKSGEVTYELGTEKKEDRFAFYLGLRVRALDSKGHCAVVVRLNNNQEVPDREVAEFCIPAEVADVNRLGKLLVQFGRLQHRVLSWSVHDGELFKEEEDGA